MVLLASCQPTLVNIQMVLLDLDATYHYYTAYFTYTLPSKLSAAFSQSMKNAQATQAKIFLGPSMAARPAVNALI